MNVARQTLKVFVADLLSNLLKFIGIVFFARILGPSRLGTFFLFQVCFAFLLSFGDLDVSGALKKRVSERDSNNRGDFLATAVMLKLPLLGVFLVLLAVLRSQVNSFLGEQLAMLLAIQVVLGNFELLLRKTVEGELKVGETALPSLIKTAIFVIGGLALVNAGQGIFGIIMAYILSTAVALLWYGYLLSIDLGDPSLACARSLFDYFKYSFVTTAGYRLFSWTDVLLIGLILSQADVGIYEVPWRVTAPVLLLGSAFTRSMFPQVSSLGGKSGNQNQIENLIAGGLSVSLLLVVPAFFGVIVLGEEILTIGFGVEYLGGLWVLVIIAGVRIFEAINDVWRDALQALNHPQLATRAEILPLTVNLTLNVILILQYGIAGAAVATCVATGLKVALNRWYLRQLTGISFPTKRIGGIMMASTGMALLLFVVEHSVTINTSWRLIWAIATGIMTYSILILLVRPLRVMIRHNVRRIADSK